MNKPLQKLRRFFSRAKKYNAHANPDALSAAYDDDDGASRLSGAFIVVLLLHIVALVGVFAFARIKDSRAAAAKTAPAPEAAAAAGATATSAPAVTPRPAPARPPGVAAAPLAPAVSPAAQVTPAVAIAALTHTDTRPAESTKGERTHVVKPGENLTKIATADGVTVAELVKFNGLKNENDLRVGQDLKIPEPAKTAARPASSKTPVADDGYTVRKGDSLIKISTTLGVKYEIVKLNNIKDPKKLREGQKLKVPKKA